MKPNQIAALGFVIGYFIYDSTTGDESTSVAVEVINFETRIPRNCTNFSGWCMSIVL